MSDNSLFKRIESLPPKTKKRVLMLIERILDTQSTADLVPAKKDMKPREFGCLAGKIYMAPDFDATPPPFNEYVS